MYTTLPHAECKGLGEAQAFGTTLQVSNCVCIHLCIFFKNYSFWKISRLRYSGRKKTIKIGHKFEKICLEP